MKTDNFQPSVLLIEDDAVNIEMYKECLSNEPVKLTVLKTGAEALAYLQKTVPAVILLDLGLPDMNGMKILEHVQRHLLDCNIIVITAENSVDIVVEAMRYGAFSFLEKPVQKNRLIVTLHNALSHNTLSTKVDIYKQTSKRQQYHDFIGVSPSMQTVYNMIACVTKSNASVLITGETGTGKELCAQAIHKAGSRKDKPFIDRNCAAIPKDLMESEIFGHVKGAFTGAVKERLGAASLANNGTLFLDEIGDMDLMLQSKLLRFVQEGTFYKVGGDTLEKVDIRFICATHHDLPLEIKAGRFREDLYHRLNVIPITLPPLRERGDDILLLARTFLKKSVQREQKYFQTFAPEVEQIFLRYSWPGNVRELQNFIERTVVLNVGKMVMSNMLPTELFNEISHRPIEPNQQISTRVQTIPPLEETEKEAILKAIKFCNGNIVQAAKLLKVSHATIYRRLQQWGIPHTLGKLLQFNNKIKWGR